MTLRRRLGVRARVVASFVVLLTGAELVSVVVLQQVGERRIDEQVTRDLVASAESLRSRVASAGDELGRPDGPSLADLVEDDLSARPARADEAQIVFLDGRAFATSAGSPVALDRLPVADRWAALTSTRSGQTDTAAGPMRWLAVPVVAGGRVVAVFVATSFVRDQFVALRSTTATVAAVTGLVLVAACLLAWGAAGRALSPVRDLATTARSVSTGDDLGAHIEVTSTDEVGELAASFNQMLDNLRVAFDSQKRFLDGAAHELRTPLTILRGHLELLDGEPAERSEDISLLLDEVDRMDRLVADLRTLARSERPDFLSLDDVDVAVFVDDLARKARGTADRAWTVDDRATGTVVADRQRLTQAMLNLVTNAVAVTDPGDPIEIVAVDVPHGVALGVCDHGPGIDPEHLPTLFDREGRTVPRRPGGTGLGLPIVAAVARAHGGCARASSSPGRTVVEVVLPRGGS